MIAVILCFFWQVLFRGLLPIPSDTVVGLYYPFRDIYSETNPNGVPFKNFLITDPVRQQYPWKNLSITSLKKFEIPLWNPYSFSGTPLLANFQSSVFYPVNILFLILPFTLGWSLFIILQPILAGIFLYLYLENLKLKKWASILGSLSFSLGGFSIAWLEWGNIMHTALWLPLILLCVDKIGESLNFKNKIIFGLILTFSLSSSLFAGHLQIFIYVLIFSFFYFIARWIDGKRNLKTFSIFFFSATLSFIVTIVQWFPTLQFIQLSARNIDVTDYKTPGWFIPWQNLVQLIAPDFFGNPTTLNYWGVWNYGEFVGYVGLLPLVMVFFALLFRKDRKTFFFAGALIISLVLAFPNLISEIPYKLGIPFFHTAQPTRLIFIITFSLSVLGALGFDYFLRIKSKINILYIISFLIFIFVGLWLFVYRVNVFSISEENLTVIRQNLILPTTLALAIGTLLFTIALFEKKKIFPKKVLELILCFIILISIFDLLRFGWKFTPFTKQEYLFPSTAVTDFLFSQPGQFRIMAVDNRILPPNFSAFYKIQTVDGYDPLYLRRYGELVAVSERNSSNINPPFGFNRIITPQNYSSKIIDFMNVKYILSFDEINNDKLDEVFKNGSVKVYENKAVLPRTFFVNQTVHSESKQASITKILNPNFDFRNTAVVEDLRNDISRDDWTIGSAEILNYKENRVLIKTNNNGEGFLVLTDSYYPTWHARIDGKDVKIYLTNYNFRGIVVPKGEHTVEFYNNLF